VAEALGALHEPVDVRFAGTGRGIESVLVPRSGYRFYRVPASGFRGLGRGARVRFLINFQLGIWRSLILLIGWRADVVLGTGGYVSAPVIVAARLLFIRCALQEQNAYPGTANRLLARWAQRIYLGVADAQRFFRPGICLETGNPVRHGFSSSREGVPADRGVADGPPTREHTVPPRSGEADELRVLVFGGSRGARSLNAAIGGAAGRLAHKERLALWIQTGTAEQAAVAEAFAPWGVRASVVSYILDMPTALRWADLAVCRAGAMTLAELAVAGKPAILVPYPHATDDHQLHNARAQESAGAALVLEDHECTAMSLADAIENLLRDRARRRRMAEAARDLARPDAAAAIATDLYALARA
jgi:UDP-N-acetylglucosamine--N-acetylmuramyl-(pentapeptide) pyrophosphoryl-undecaprenol N-acetylglucosamine transferase